MTRLVINEFDLTLSLIENAAAAAAVVGTLAPVPVLSFTLFVRVQFTFTRTGH